MHDNGLRFSQNCSSPSRVSRLLQEIPKYHIKKSELEDFVIFVPLWVQVKVLRSMRPIQLEDVITGQYKGHSKGAKSYPGYLDDPTVPKGSITPTFAAAALFINNARWDGVPFLMKAGKALHTKR